MCRSTDPGHLTLTGFENIARRFGKRRFVPLPFFIRRSCSPELGLSFPPKTIQFSSHFLNPQWDEGKRRGSGSCRTAKRSHGSTTRFPESSYPLREGPEHLDRREKNRARPEVVLLNSHDKGSAYQLHCGLFRLVCSNGMVVSDATFARISTKHSGFLHIR